MKRWTWSAGAAMLALGGCVLPLSITVGDDAGVRIRGSGHVVSVSRSVPEFDAVSAERF